MSISHNSNRAWKGIVSPPYSERKRKPRSTGVTMVIDKGMGTHHLKEFLEMCSDYIDFVKFTFGTSALYSESTLIKKIEMLREESIRVFPGGTFAELALLQGKFSEYLNYAEEVGFDAVEISDGSIELPADHRLSAIVEAKNAGFETITEVGKKHPHDSRPVERLIELIHTDLQTGADYVVLEARESGREVTIFDAAGNIRGDDLSLLLGTIGDSKQEKLIWEAPRSAHQKQFILQMGPNVNLGNVAPEEVLALEALRLGLRGDTLRSYVKDRPRRLRV